MCGGVGHAYQAYEGWVMLAQCAPGPGALDGPDFQGRSAQIAWLLRGDSRVAVAVLNASAALEEKDGLAWRTLSMASDNLATAWGQLAISGCVKTGLMLLILDCCPQTIVC